MNIQAYQTAEQTYLSTLPSLRKSSLTIRGYASIIHGFGEYLERIGGEISPLTLTQWRTERFEGAKSNTINHYLSVLSKFFDWAVENRLLEQNPVTDIEKPKKEEIVYNLLSFEEIQMLFTEIPKGINSKTALRNRAIIVMLLQVGLRNTEIRLLSLSNLHFEQSSITVTNGKGRKCREVPFPKLAQETVIAYLNSGVRPEWAGEDDYLFGTDADEHGHSTGGKVWHPISSTALLLMANRYIKRVTGHENVCVHALRHAAASFWDDLEVPIRDIQQALGHSSVQTTERVYVKILNRHKAANRINAAFDNRG